MDFISVADGVAGYVKHYEDTVQNGNHTITFTGVELKGITQNRIVIPPTGVAYEHYRETPEFVIASLIQNHITAPTDGSRRILGTIPDFPVSEGKITYDGRYKNLAEEIETLATTYNVGWCASIEDSAIVWHIWHGINRTAEQSQNNRMILDYEYGTMNDSSFAYGDSVPTYMIVAGQGEGASRAIAEIQRDGANLTRIETFLDARDIEDNTLLPQRGEEKLAEFGDNISYTATLSNQAIKQYRVDFELGDIGTIRDEKLGENLNYQITAIEEIYEGNQLAVNMTFGYDKNMLKDAIKRMNSKRDSLLAVESYGSGSSAGTGNGEIETDANGNVIINFNTNTPVSDDGEGNVVVGDNNFSGGSGCECEEITVNGVAPVEGNITLTPDDIGAAEANHSHNISLSTITNAMFPVGSTYTTTTNTNPSSKLGGTWELINKSFTPLFANGSSYFTTNTTNFTFTSCYINRVGNTVALRLNVKNNVALSDNTLEVGTFNFDSIGITRIHNTQFSSNTYSDALNGVIQYQVNYETGALENYDVVGNYSTSTGLSIFYCFDFVLKPEYMLDSACNQFIWERTA